jgi:hypothetical protein
MPNTKHFTARNEPNVDGQRARRIIASAGASVAALGDSAVTGVTKGKRG